jgi:bifunctional non-homologous end joining protein LigD
MRNRRLDHQGSPDFAGLQAALSEKATEDLIFYAFDLLYLGAKDLRQQSLLNRKQSLKRLIEKICGPGRNPLRRTFREWG